MIENTYKVNKRQWQKWTPHARRVFNFLYSFMINNQSVFMHPEGVYQGERQWKTIVHNASWIAADGVDQA